ncbi:hypothetical protein [Paracidovorax citrulli]|uniref:hypothetical protein n=1 Tax=Paracidovorax citrulli TaxID=80869 RepID=UPI000A69DF89
MSELVYVGIDIAKNSFEVAVTGELQRSIWQTTKPAMPSCANASHRWRPGSS